MAEKVTGDQYYELDGQLSEIKRQLRQLNGYSFSIETLKVSLQNIIEGKFIPGGLKLLTKPFDPVKFLHVRIDLHVRKFACILSEDVRVDDLRKL